LPLGGGGLDSCYCATGTPYRDLAGNCACTQSATGAINYPQVVTNGVPVAQSVGVTGILKNHPILSLIAVGVLVNLISKKA